MNIRLIKYSTLGMLFALAASCADEELIQTSGYRDGEAVTLSFNISVPAETEVAVTRATDSENKVNDKDLPYWSSPTTRKTACCSRSAPRTTTLGKSSTKAP